LQLPACVNYAFEDGDDLVVGNRTLIVALDMIEHPLFPLLVTHGQTGTPFQGADLLREGGTLADQINDLLVDPVDFQPQG